MIVSLNYEVHIVHRKYTNQNKVTQRNGICKKTPEHKSWPALRANQKAEHQQFMNTRERQTNATCGFLIIERLSHEMPDGTPTNIMKAVGGVMNCNRKVTNHLGENWHDSSVQPGLLNANIISTSESNNSLSEK